MSWTIDCVVVGPIECNCYILSDSVTRKAVLVDPGAESLELLAFLQKKELDLQGILVTHAHIDHVGGIEMVQAKLPAPVYYHAGDRFLYEDLARQAMLFGVTPAQLQARQPRAIDTFIQDGQEFELGSDQISVIHTPGHTPGSVCYQAHAGTAVVFSGDTLFEGSIGRTDLWGGSYEEIMISIRSRLLSLEDSIRVLPGHGPATTIGEERRHNPFLNR